MNCSLNFKILLLALALLLVLVVLIFKAVMIRQRRVTWLEDINRRIAPLAMEDLVGTLSPSELRATMEGRAIETPALPPQTAPPAGAPLAAPAL
jgi:hypothetical protein